MEFYDRIQIVLAKLIVANDLDITAGLDFHHLYRRMIHHVFLCF